MIQPPLPHWSCSWVLLCANTFHYGGLIHEGAIALQLPRGKQVPWCLWLGGIWSSSHGSFQKQGISSFCPSFQFPHFKEQFRVTSGVFTIHFVGQHVPVFRVWALTEMIPFHLLYVLLLNPSWVLWQEHLDLLQQVHSEFSHILSRSLLEGIKFLAKGIKCHHYTLMLIKHLQDIR